VVGCTYIHFIGKDNIVFHCLIFPAILRAHGGYILPVNVPANQFLNLEGRKLSTSKNWAVWVHEYLEEFAGREDELRYNLIKNMPEQRDSEFTWKGYQETTNKYYDGRVPDFDPNNAIIDSGNQADTSFHDSELLAIHDQLQDLSAHIRSFDFRGALTILLGISSRGNQLLQFNEPWKTIKTDPEVVKVVMNTAVAILNTLAEGNPIVPVGHEIGKPNHLFTRVEDSLIDTQLEKLNATAAAAAATTVNYEPVKETISYEDFSKLDIRTGTIVTAEKVKKTKKLLKLEVDMGLGFIISEPSSS